VASTSRRQIDQLAREIEATEVELKRLRRPPNIHPTHFWQDAAEVPLLLGAGAAAERRAVAEFILGRCVEWDFWVQRWITYFGRDEDEIPRRWKVLRQMVLPDAESILRDPGFSAAIVEPPGSDVSGNGTEASSDRDDPQPRHLFYRIARLDRLNRLLEAADAPERRMKNWQSKLVEITHEAQSLPTSQQQSLYRLVRNYRHSMLLLSWLDAGWFTHFASQVWERSEMQPNNWIDQVTHSLAARSNQRLLLAHPDISQTARDVLTRLNEAVGQLGYDEFLADIQSADFRPGPGTPLGAQSINLIPGESRWNCLPLLVAFSKGGSGKGSLSFERVMKRVKTHLIDCSDTTIAVIFVCDLWDSRSFAENHFEELSAHHHRGVSFAFLQVGAPRTMIGPVAIDLSHPNVSYLLDLGITR